MKPSEFVKEYYDYAKQSEKKTSVAVSESTLTGDDIGVSFAVQYNAGLVELRATLTSTGTGATFDYDVTRINYNP